MIAIPEDLTDALKAEARRLGFVACGVTGSDTSHANALGEWLMSGAHGEMGWMEARAEQRASPQALWPAARSVVALAMSYAPAHDPLATTPGAGRISAYAQGRDYHDVVKKALKALARWLIENGGGDVKVFVDTAPVMEKPLGQQSGLGWQGKHTNLVSREHGSWLFLGSIFSTLELVRDAPEADHCGSCTACQAACPTNAFPAPYRLDARRCISYLTIEHKGPIPLEFRAAIEDRIYGCDDCLAVCPWNKFADHGAANLAFAARPELLAPSLAELLAIDDAAFRALFSKSPIKRIGRDRMVRNALIAAGNSGLLALIALVIILLNDPAPVVRGAAVWALSKLDPGRHALERGNRLYLERDPGVRAEWG
jgi:epoxyqueuosine reductase